MDIDTRRVIYPQGGGICILVPGKGWTAEAVAAKDVPPGVPYRIVAMDDIPVDRSQRHLWTADFSEPDGYGGAGAGA